MERGPCCLIFILVHVFKKRKGCIYGLDIWAEEEGCVVIMELGVVGRGGGDRGSWGIVLRHPLHLHLVCYLEGTTVGMRRGNWECMGTTDVIVSEELDCCEEGDAI